MKSKKLHFSQATGKVAKTAGTCIAEWLKQKQSLTKFSIMTKTEQLFDEVITTIQQRGSVYGHPYYNHKRIAGLWSAYLDFPITPHQAALCMALVKVSRLSETPDHEDSIKDFIAYGSVYKTVLDAVKDETFEWEDK